jgi:hypothetical protein
MTSLEQMHGVLSEVQSVHTSTQRQTLLLNSTSAKTMDTLELMMTNLDQNMTSLTGLINDARLLIFPLRELRVSFVCRYKMTPDVANKFQNDVQLKVSEPFVRSLDDSFGKLTGVAMVLLRTYGGFSLTMGGGSTEILVDRTLPGKDDLMRYAVASDILYIYYNCGIDLYSGGETERLLTIEDVENAYWQLDLTTHLKSDVYPLDHSKKFNGVTYEGMLPVVCISIESNVLTEQVYGDLEVKKGKLLRTPWEGSLQAENVSAKVMPFRYTRKKLAHNRFGVPDTLIPKEFLPIRLPFYERNR